MTVRRRDTPEVVYGFGKTSVKTSEDGERPTEKEGLATSEDGGIVPNFILPRSS